MWNPNLDAQLNVASDGKEAEPATRSLSTTEYCNPTPPTLETELRCTVDYNLVHSGTSVCQWTYVIKNLRASPFLLRRSLGGGMIASA